MCNKHFISRPIINIISPTKNFDDSSESTKWYILFDNKCAIVSKIKLALYCNVPWRLWDDTYYRTMYSKGNSSQKKKKKERKKEKEKKCFVSWRSPSQFPHSSTTKFASCFIVHPSQIHLKIFFKVTDPRSCTFNLRSFLDQWPSMSLLSESPLCGHNHIKCILFYS